MLSLTAVGTSSVMVAPKLVLALRPAVSWTVSARLSKTLLPAAVCGPLML